jgi:hypothetical protein
MKKILLVLFLLLSIAGKTQVTILNGTNLYGSVFTNTANSIIRSNISNSVELLSGITGSCTLDTALNLSCYDSLKIVFTVGRTYLTGTGYVYNVSIPVGGGTYTVTSFNLLNLSIPVSISGNFNQQNKIHVSNLKIFGFPTPTCSLPPIQPVAVIGSTFPCQNSNTSYSVNPVCGATSYSWSLPGGWTGTSTTNIITSTVGSGGGIISVIAINNCGNSSAQTLSVNINATPPPGPIGNIFGASVVCSLTSNQYSISAVTGATSYSWSLPAGWNGGGISNVINSFANGGSGIVSVWATNSCGSIGPQTLTVTVNPLPSIYILGTNSVCTGSSLTLSGIGGVTYTWNTGSNSSAIIVTPTANTSYTLMGTDANGCVNTKTIAIYTGTAVPTLSITGSQTVCQGNNAWMFVTGANTYYWSNGTIGANNSSIIFATTTFSVIGTSTSGCTSTAAITVSLDPFSPTITISPIGSICPGATTILTASGANTYTWDTNENTNSITISPTGTTFYTVLGMGQMGACISSATIAVNVYSLPIVNVVSSDPTICIGQTATLTASGSSSYNWQIGGQSNFIVVSPTISTTYIVAGTDLHGCVNTVQFDQYVIPCSGFAENSGNDEFKFFPNPVANTLFFVSEKDGINLELFDAIGQKVISVSVNKGESHIDMLSLTSGIYFLKVCDQDQFKILKILKE